MNLTKKILRYVLLPLTPVYDFVTFIRNKFYDFNLIKSYKFQIPVISVGNLTTGGTGKTPLVICIAEYFMKNDFKTAIISRGYKRNKRETVVVFEGDDIICNIDECGDELFLITNTLKKYGKKLIILADKNRVRAGKIALDKYKPDIILLDDAFQHRSILRDIDILMIDSNDYKNHIIRNNLLLPAGNLREPINNISRCDIIVQNNKFYDYKMLELIKSTGRDFFIANYEPCGFYDVNSNEVRIQNSEIIPFAGVANPDSFFEFLSDKGFKIKKNIIFDDHVKYTEKDIKKLTSLYESGNSFITTEKDFYKICRFIDFVKTYPLYFLKIKISIKDEQSFFEILRNKLKNKNRQHIND